MLYLPCRTRPSRNVSCSCSDHDRGALFSFVLSPAVIKVSTSYNHVTVNAALGCMERAISPEPEPHM